MSTSAFSAGGPIPPRYSCDGDDISPALSWGPAPEGAESLVLIMDDPDAPGKIWDHWVVFNIPTGILGLAEAQPKGDQLAVGGVHGKNSWGKKEYGGPCPPSGSPHTYRFFLYAVDTTLDLSAGASKQRVLEAIDGHIVAESMLTGTYERGGGADNGGDR